MPIRASSSSVRVRASGRGAPRVRTAARPTSPDDAKVRHRISWRVESLDDLREFHRRFVDEGVRIQQEVTQDNRNVVYLRIERDVPQPFRKTLNLNQEPEAVYAEAERQLNNAGSAYQPVI
jgi:hypothetical protein